MSRSGPTAAGTTEPLKAADLAAYPDFAEIPAKQWERQFEFTDRAVVRRRFRKGEIICREGDYGSTAFYIASGKVSIFISAPIAHAKSSKTERAGQGLLGLIRRFATGLVPARQDARDEEQFRRWIPIDAPIDLAYDNPVGQLGAGELFGEMTCMSFYPRSATVQAAEDCELLEMLRNVLEVLKKSKSFKAKIESNYRQRALTTHLRSVREFADLPDEFIDHLRPRVELLTFEPGDVICNQGDPADSLYLIRIGFVQVSQRHPGGDLVLAYLSRGQYFGEMGLISGGVRTANCRALDHVEVVRIGKEDFDAMVERYPTVRDKLKAEADRRAAATRLQTQASTQVPLDKFLEQGLMNAQNVLLIDLEKCTRCDECVHACGSAHGGVTRLLRDGLRYDKYLVTTSCRQCTDPLCMIGCPVGSIRRRESLEVIIEDWCIGCEKCAKQCPYGNITIHNFDVTRLDRVYEGQKVFDIEEPGEGSGKRAVIKKATTCDLCSGLAEPSCVYACPHDAAIRVHPQEFFSGQFRDHRSNP
jgi:CRP-like cAMP-binding protein/Fe-S-cluster-containing hydrogenase component 2